MSALFPADPSRPPRLRSRSDATLLYVLLTIATLLGSADLVGAIANAIDGRPFRLASLNGSLHFLFGILRHGGDPARSWPSIPAASFSAVGFWSLAGLMVAVIALAAWQLWRVFRHHSDAPTHEGFASTSALSHVASVEAAIGRAPQTRPSLVGQTIEARDVGYPLGSSLRPKGVTLRPSWEASLQLVAPPGVGKTLRVLTRILRQHPGPAFATSTKADFYEVTVGARRGPVFALDPERLVPAAPRVRWSPILGCEETQVAERRAAALIAATGENTDVRSGAFFRQSAIAVLGAYLHAAALTGNQMGDVLRWAARPTDPAPRRILSQHGDPQIDWASRLVEHTTGAEETTSGVMRTVDLALACFRHAEVLELCSIDREHAFDFTDALERGATIYALGKDRGAASIGASALITAFADELLLAAEQLAADQDGRRLDPPLLAILDEAPSIVPLPGLPALVADGRGRGITVIYAMQSFSQAVARWGEHDASTMRNATTITAVFGGLSVANDLRELSELCGTRKVLRHAANSEWRSGNDGISASWVDEPVLTPAEIRSLPEGTLLLLWDRLAPVLAYQPGTWEGPDAKEIRDQERKARDDNNLLR